MIRRADLEVVHVMVVERGAARFSQGMFNRTFRAAYGAPPGDYRARATGSVAGGQPAGGRGQ
ncbi:hypothetical protein AB0K14_23065 [Actinosynnema sp. NPDC050801]|uniref:hypothetical protein n=1 Tax=unclassified Actinosynnema TaxID=2637065 RepID=UPI0033ECE14C